MQLVNLFKVPVNFVVSWSEKIGQEKATNFLKRET